MSMNRAEIKTGWTLATAFMLFAALQAGSAWLNRLLANVDQSILHLLLESLGFALCIAILTLGWMVFVPTLCRQRLITAALFAAVGAFDLLHALSSRGMPLYQTTIGSMPSLLLDAASGLFGAAGLLLIFSTRNVSVSSISRLLLLVPLLAVIAGACWLVLAGPNWNEPWMISALTYVYWPSILLYGTAIGIILYRNRQERPQAMLTIVQALVWLFFSRLEFVAGSSNGHMLLAEGFKLIGYYYLLKGIYYVLIEEPYKRQKETEASIHVLAYHDELTGLPNRRQFKERVRGEMDRARTAGRRFALLWLDLDRFKTINDSMGHAFGDVLLMSVAERLIQFTGKKEDVFRLGGDEFTILVADLANDDQAEQAAQRLVDLFSAPVHVGHSTLHITGSVGMAVFPNDGDSVDQLLQNADTAMYRAKEGRNAWKRYVPAMNRKAKERLLLENDLRIALELGQFHLAYQPLVDLGTERLVGAEALLRWNHPQKGDVPPSEFIPLCEENGFILPLGEWVLLSACHQMKLWQDSGYPPIILSVNLSIRQFRQPDLCERVRRALERSGLAPEWLELEITESIMADVAYATEMLENLKKIGVRISIDDFGTGYSSLHYLKRFPIDKLKIDRSFVSDVLSDRNDAAIVSGISAMARNLNLKVTAEGVENEAQVEFLKLQKCQEAQGYFFSRPVAPDRFVDLFAEEIVTNDKPA